MFAFPNNPLKSGQATDLLSPYNIRTYHEAIIWIWKLPYGRNSDRSKYLLVPTEQKGACSTKHAFLSQVAMEQKINLHLCVGIFMMNRENTPGIVSTLEDNGLTAIPEAHCFLKYEDNRYDFTFYNNNDSKTPHPSLDFLYEEIISPDSIGEYKIDLHKRWIKKWLSESNESISFENLWLIREKCIQALS